MTTGEKSGRERVREFARACFAFDAAQRHGMSAAEELRVKSNDLERAIAADLDTLAAARRAAEELGMPMQLCDYLSTILNGEDAVKLRRVFTILTGGAHADRG